MSEEESNTISVAEEQKTEEDTHTDKLIPLVCCTICTLFIVMIILLMMLSSAYSVSEAAKAEETERPKYLSITSDKNEQNKSKTGTTSSSTFSFGEEGGHTTAVTSTSSTAELSTTVAASVLQPITASSATPMSTKYGRKDPASTTPAEKEATTKFTVQSTVELSSKATTTTSATKASTKSTMTSARPTTRPPTTGKTTRTTTKSTTMNPTTASSLKTTAESTTLAKTTPASTASTTTKSTVTTTTPFPGKPSRPGKPPRRYTLICAFEYLDNSRWPAVHQCTDYVYMRTFNYQGADKAAENDTIIFGGKRLKLTPDTMHNIYYDTSYDYWLLFKRADRMVRYSKRLYPHADWYLGMWGQTYIRLLNTLWPAPHIMKGLHTWVRSEMSPYMNASYFEGFAIVNSLIMDYRGYYQANQTVKLNIFRNKETPVLMPGWLFIHTAAIWPYGPVGVNGIPESFIQDVINSADIVGISTHNSSEEPPNLYFHAGVNGPSLFASPPNPIRGATPQVRGMLDIIAEFPHWKKVLNRTQLCLSVTTAINYARAHSYGMDFIIPPTETIKMTRRNFTQVNPVTGKLEVESRYMKYEWWERAASHAFVVRPVIPGQVGPLNAFISYDDAATLAPKMKAVLDAYPDDRCVLFEDLGDDSFEGGFTYNATTVRFGSFDFLKVVSSAMTDKYGGTAFPPKYNVQPKG